MIPARARPYWSFVEASAIRHGFEAHTFEFGAIIDRESLFGVALTPEGPTGVGDFGHGRGLCQIDDRAHPLFLSKLGHGGLMLWQDAEANIDYGASLFAQDLARFAYDLEARLICAIASYNAGPLRVRMALEDLTAPSDYRAKLEALNHITTDGKSGPYVSDVLTRAAQFRAPKTLKEVS